MRWLRRACAPTGLTDRPQFHPETRSRTVTTIPAQNPASRAVAEAVQCLEPYAGDSRYSDLIRRLESLQQAHESEQPEPDHEGEVASVLAEAEGVAKSETAAPAVRERARKAAASLQYEHLAKMSPAAAQAWRTRQAL